MPAVEFRERILSGPLKAHSLDGRSHLRIGEDAVPEVRIGPFHRPKVHIDVPGGHFRLQVLQERDQAFRGPGAGREHLVRVRLVLRHHHENVDALGLVRVDELAEILGIRLQVSRFQDERIDTLGDLFVQRKPVERGRAGGIMPAHLHPRRRAPGRCPNPKGRIHGLRRPDERNQHLPVPVDGKVLQRQVAGDLVVGVKVHAEVVGTQRHPGHRQVHPRGREQILEDCRAVFLGKLRQRGPSQLIETGTKAFDRLIHGRKIHNDGGIDRLIGSSGLHHLPGMVESARNPFHPGRLAEGEQEDRTRPNNNLSHRIGLIVNTLSYNPGYTR